MPINDYAYSMLPEIIEVSEKYKALEESTSKIRTVFCNGSHFEKFIM